MKRLAIAALAALTLSGCSILGKNQSVDPILPPVKVITETVQLEIYQPPLPQEIAMQDVTWHVITNKPCKPATGQDSKTKLYTTDKYQRDAEGNRVELGALTDNNGKVIEVCGNIDEKIYQVEKELGGDFVIMAITPKGYENMAYNLQEIKRYINQQKEIILYYREATAVDKGDDAEDWTEKNKANQADQIEDAERDNETQAHNESLKLAPKEEKSSFSNFTFTNLIPKIGN